MPIPVSHSHSASAAIVGSALTFAARTIRSAGCSWRSVVHERRWRRSIGYTVYGAAARPGSLPGAEVVAVIGGSTFIPWLVLPGAHPAADAERPAHQPPDATRRLGDGRRWASSPSAPGWCARTTATTRRSASSSNPLEVSLGPTALRHPLGRDHRGASRRARRRGGDRRTVPRRRGPQERLQLRWLGMAAIPFVLFVFGASIAAVLNNQVVLGSWPAVWSRSSRSAVGLSIEQYHLYDVERLVSRAVTGSCSRRRHRHLRRGRRFRRAVDRPGEDSAIPAVVATLAAVSIAGSCGAGFRTRWTAASTAVASRRSPCCARIA